MEPISSELNDIGTDIVSAATKIHSAFGPGLLESTYRICLAHELSSQGRAVRMEVDLPIEYEGMVLPKGYRIDMLIDEQVIVELKACETLLGIHEAQLLTYLRLSRRRLGYLLNFNVRLMKEGIWRRVV